MWIALPSSKLSDNRPFELGIVLFSPMTVAAPLRKPVNDIAGVLVLFSLLPAPGTRKTVTGARAFSPAISDLIENKRVMPITIVSTALF